MPDVTQNVIIDFSVDYSQLTNAQEQLAKAGKIDDKGFKAIQAAISTTATDTQSLIKEFKNVGSTAIRMGKSVEQAFSSGVQDALDEAGVSVEEFADALKKANAPAITLKKEMLQLKEALARMKAEGKDTGAEFEALRARAGKLQDAIHDANAEIKNAGSDTRGIDNVVGSISALAGGFAAVQGASALFGDENEDLQKSLLKVNGAMALATGLQQVYNASLKEGAIAKLADSIQTGAQTAAITLYTFVTGGATVATRLFRAALLATGIGAIVVLVLALADAFNKTSHELEDATKLIENQTAVLELNNAAIDRNLQLQEAQAKAAGASESKLIALRGKSLLQKRDLLLIDQKILVAQRDTLDGTSEAYGKINNQIQANADALRDVNAEIQVTGVRLKEAIGDEGKAAAKKRADELKAARLAGLRDELAALELQLLAVEKNSQAEVNIKKKIVAKKADIELQAEKLTANQIKLINAQSLQDQLDLQSDFNKKLTENKLNAQINTNKAILAGIIEDNKERLGLEIENIQASAQLEINAAEGNAAKILEINARMFQQIRDLKNASIKRELSDQLAANAGIRNRLLNNLNAITEDVKKSKGERIAAAYAIEAAENTVVDQEIANNNKLIQSDKDRDAANKILEDKKIDNAQKRANTIKKINKSVVDEEIANLTRTVSVGIEIATQVGNIYAQLSAAQTQRDAEIAAARKKEIQDLLDAGAITQKEAEQRQKTAEAAEKAARRRAAQREKNLAVFTAALEIPKAFLKGLSDGGIVLAALYAALAAANAAIIASKPIPQFFRGKRDTYEGPGIVADMGAELVERNGRMFLYTKPTQTYLAASDKVYTAAQSKQILHNADTSRLHIHQGNSDKFDYEKFGAAIPKAAININIDKEFISESVAQGLSRTNYMDRRYSSK